MGEAVVAAVGLLVFGALWATSQDWFDFLPRAWKRTFRSGCFGLFLLTLWLAPSAWQAGVRHFVQWRAASVQHQVQQLMQDLLDRMATVPSTSPAPSGAPPARSSPCCSTSRASAET